MRRLVVLTLALFLLSPPDRAFAHGLGQTYDLPIPFWLYFFSASAAGLISFVQIPWWVGFSFFTAFVGNVWPLVNPWKTLFEWADALVRRLGAEGGLELREPYQTSFLGIWPALAFYSVFVWTELVFQGRTEPYNIALLALFYSGVTWGGMIIFGKEAWLRRGEAFSVFFGLLGRFAPTEVRVKNPSVCQGCDGCEPGWCVNCY